MAKFKNKWSSGKAWFLSFGKDFYRALQLTYRVSPNNTLLQFFFQILVAILPVGILYATKSLFDEIMSLDRDFEQVMFWLIALGLGQLLVNLIQQLLSYLGQIQQQKITDHTIGLMLEKSIAIPFSYFEDDKYHDNVHLAQKQALYKLPLILQHFQVLFTNVLSLLFLMAYFFTLITAYAWIILLVVLPLAIVKWYNGYVLHRLEKKLVPMERQAAYYHQILTSTTHAKELRSLNFGQSFIKRFSKIRKHIFTKKEALQQKLLRYSLLAESLEVIALFIVLFGVVQQAFLETIAISLLVVYIQGLQRIQSNLKGFLLALVNLFHQRIFLRDLFKFFELAETVEKPSSTPFSDKDFSIEIKNLSFSYGKNFPEVLKNINMTLPMGKMIGLVGANGSGKSTLVKLIAGLYNAQEGDIIIGNHKLQEINPTDFRKNTVFLFQDFQKYFLSIKEIISIGDDENAINTDRLDTSIFDANADTFIDQLKNGVDTKMGRIFFEGQELSGGQWQKLAIARAFYRNASIVVLDEPTSALDALSENHIFEQLRRVAADKVILLITHRLYNLKECDHIYVVDEGKIAQEGNFSQLASEQGIFQNLYQQQRF